MTRNLWKWLWVLVVVAFTATAFGQISVPPTSEPYRLIPAKLTTPIPAGAYLADGGWEVVGATIKQVPDIQANGPELIWTGTPGAYTVLFDGVLLTDVTVPGLDGKPVTIKSYLGKIKDRAVCTITGTPGPDPIDPPLPGGKYRIVFFYNRDQLDNLPQGQRDILNSLTFRKWLAAEGHNFLEVLDPASFTAGSVPAQWQPWLNTVANDPLPRIALAPLTDAGPIADFALPADPEACKALLKAPATRKAVAR
jgi:hypothetical protein